MDQRLKKERFTKSIFSLKLFDELKSKYGFNKKEAYISILYIVVQPLIGSGINCLHYIYHLMIFNKYGYSNNFTHIDVFIKLIGIIVSLLPIFLILKIYKQKIESIGLKLHGCFISLLLGIIASVPIILLIVITEKFLGQKINTDYSMLLKFLVMHVFFVAVPEELMFMGYFQPRILVLFKKQWGGVLLVGFMFAISHMPYQILRGATGLSNYFQRYWIFLLLAVIFHVIKTILYQKSKNLSTPIVFHGLTNFAYIIMVKN